MVEIKTFIKRKRKEAGLSQAELAKVANVAIRLVRDLEQGRKISFRTYSLNRILKLFGKKLGVVDLRQNE